MNLETRLNECLNDVLRSAGYMFEIINKNKKQSNFITGTNNQLIPPIITAQLGSSISKFDDVLDETMGKFDDARWCIDSMVESKQKQVEMRKEEEERQRKLKEEEEAKKQEAIKEEERKREEARKEEARKEEARKEEARKEQMKKEKPEEKKDDFDFMQFDFMNDVSNDIPNPSDILSSIDYLDLNPEKKESEKEEKKVEDLDINNILGNNDSILDGLNMSLLDEQPQDINVEEDFDVDNFLNQFDN